MTGKTTTKAIFILFALLIIGCNATPSENLVMLAPSSPTPTAAAQQPQTITGKVVAVADGDKLTVLDANKQQRKIRLVGIDPGAVAARESLKRVREQMLAALNDPEAVKRGEERFEEGIDIILSPEDWESSNVVPASEDREKFAAALREIIDSVPPRQVRRVGWDGGK